MLPERRQRRKNGERKNRCGRSRRRVARRVRRKRGGCPPGRARVPPPRGRVRKSSTPPPAESFPPPPSTGPFRAFVQPAVFRSRVVSVVRPVRPRLSAGEANDRCGVGKRRKKYRSKKKIEKRKFCCDSPVVPFYARVVVVVAPASCT